MQLLLVQLLAATDAAAAVQLLPVQLLAATHAPAVQLLQVAAHVQQLLLQQLLQPTLQSHQQLSSSCPYRENLTACDPLDRKPFCIVFPLMLCLVFKPSTVNHLSLLESTPPARDNTHSSPVGSSPVLMNPQEALATDHE